ncbi:exopolysaccharide biosynthesis polyprenyl glycosylphosphotransferase [Catellatospora methionotrophica]|uniref:Exopolysaccharide biosynthesis polyprenyl glycosylphosphotransferase n=1 Tax=Catellatospora methionotrophica TaxID=121620 RepID=A0A8J3LHS0_9ACTN|nr:sugar transferase [Catellatospora methionotrophica]GIG18485.1 exopolysaccharide biosynthesis polyprenyl glycosylphosphotransferase [Catellatospora methionotrophica]
MEQRRDDDRRGPRPYPQRHRHIDASGALSYTATPTPAGPAPFSPAPVGLVAVRPQTPTNRPAASRRPLHRGSTHIGTPMRVLDRRKGWEQRYLRTLLGSDLLVGAAAGVLVYMLRFGTSITPYTSTYVLLSLAFPFALLASLALTRAYDKRYLYVGTQEYDRVMRGGLWLIATAAVGSYALELPTARSYVLIALPAATGTLVVTRFAIRKRLHRRRERGSCLRRTIVVGHELAIIGLTRQLCRERFHGLEVVGACVPRGSDGRVGLPVYGTFDDVAPAVRAAGADTVIVLSCPELDGHALRRMAWQLERDEIDLIVASSLIDVAGGRTTIRPVDGLPMLHVEHPRLSGGSRVMKELMDRAGAALLLVLSAPLLLVIAMALRIDSAGPALFKQVRVGRDGREFVIYKFRTMYTDAEARLAELKHLNEHDGVLFKIRDDPRVTAMGKWMRRYSLDELPQLLNVLLGQMSLVGPRPPLPREVAAYADDVRRRLAVKPGMTGLWQVSGRSDLPWEEAVRLDLRYVENWSMSMDLLILLRTLTAVARSSGAY